MTIYDGLDEMREWIRRHDWDGLDREFHARCENVDPSAARRIADIPLLDYELALRAALAQIGSAPNAGIEALYWEFDVDNGWDSAFFRCRRYEPENAGNDEWAADFHASDVVPGPSAPGLAAEFTAGWDGDPVVIGRNLYLIGRTIAAIGRASTGWSAGHPLCAGYHDQDRVYRIRGA